jgi:hypothetical protein
MRNRNVPMPHVRYAGSTAAIWLACLVFNTIPMATAASAHVKWFVTCNASAEPLPLRAVFTPTFWLFSGLFVTVFSVACAIEESALGAFLSRLLDRWTEPLHRRTDALLRAVAAISFALLWADGSVILTPELKGGSVWLSAIQVLIPIFLFLRATLPAAAAGILVLYGYGAATYGLFHMLDYPFFLGLGAYFALSVVQNAKLRALRFDCLRWTVALSLMWPSMEKFLYPGWIAPIATAHPELTLGFDVGTFITAAGVVEFGLSFALFWTPLVRRLAAAGLALVLFAATFDFGKMDGIGHLMLMTILLLVFADPGRKPTRCRAAVAPFVSGTVLLALLFLYAGIHTLYYRAPPAALVPLASGAALLMVSFFCLLRIFSRLVRWLIMDSPWHERRELMDALTRTVQGPQGLAKPRRKKPPEWLVPPRGRLVSPRGQTASLVPDEVSVGSRSMRRNTRLAPVDQSHLL